MKRRSDRRNELEASHAEDHSVARDIALIVAGIGIGSGIALLVAPDSGEEIRHAIGRRYLKTMRHLGRRTENLRDRLEDLVEHANDLRSSKLRRFLRRRAVERAVERRLRAA
jgi:gas vesicle protein